MSGRGPGNHSALATLTATYTDSEEEDDIVEQPSSLVPSPQANSNSHDGNSGSSTSESRTRNPLGLEAYQDDQGDYDDIDEDAIMTDNEAKSDGAHDSNVEDITMTEDADQVEGADMSESGSNAEGGENSRRVKVRIPPEPPGKCSAELQQRMAKLYERKLNGGLDMNKYIQSNKNFRNPSIYEKLIKHCNIDELGTNYPRDVYDPHFWGESSYYDELAKVQKAEMDKREKEKKERTKVEFQSGTVKKSLVLPSASASQSENENRRKSKWDQRGAMPNLVVPPTVQMVHPNITTSATGTKSTIINAFGNLPKKSK